MHCLWKPSLHNPSSLGLLPSTACMPLDQPISSLSLSFHLCKGKGWIHPVGFFHHNFFHYYVFFFFFLNEILDGTWHGSQMKVKLSYLKLGCLLGLPCSPGAVPRRPQASSDPNVNIIGLDYLQVPSSSVIMLPRGVATAGFSISSHLCSLVPTGKDLLGKSLRPFICGSPWWLIPQP